MPEMGGGETFDRLRAVDPQVKVLLSSGYSINGDAKDIMGRGCNGFIQKPFVLEALSKRSGKSLIEQIKEQPMLSLDDWKSTWPFAHLFFDGAGEPLSDRLTLAPLLPR